MSLGQFLDRWRDIPIRVRGIGLLIILTLLLIGMAAHEQVRRVTGEEIIVKAYPVDPRDMLRGAYVAIDYDIEDIHANELSEPPLFTSPLVGQTLPVWLVVNRAPDGCAVSRVLERKPAAIGKDDILLRAKWRNARELHSPVSPPTNRERGYPNFTVDIGADRYFADEARAKELQQAISDRQFQVVLSIGGDGRAVIKGLVLDGVRHDETFF